MIFFALLPFINAAVPGMKLICTHIGQPIPHKPKRPQFQSVSMRKLTQNVVDHFFAVREMTDFPLARDLILHEFNFRESGVAYMLKKLLGKGGFGVVYEAIQVASGRVERAALKISILKDGKGDVFSKI